MTNNDLPIKNPSPFAKTIVVGVIAIVLLPVISKAWRWECLRWQAAAAFNAYDSGEKTESIEQLMEIASLGPQALEIQLQLAEILRQEQRFEEALATLDSCYEHIEAWPQPYSLRSQIKKFTYHETRLNILFALRNASESNSRSTPPKNNVGISIDRAAFEKQVLAELEPMRELLPKLVENQKLAINHFSYFCALAELLQDQAYADMKVLFASNQNAPFAQMGLQCEFPTAVLAASVLLASEFEVTEDLEYLLDNEIDLQMLERDAAFASVFDGVIRLMLTGPNADNQPESLDSKRKILDSQRGDLAILLLARALLRDHENDFSASQRDRQTLKDLGFSEENLLLQLPSLESCAAYCSVESGYIDTYGWLQRARAMPEEALSFINLAITATELAHAARSRLQLESNGAFSPYEITSSRFKSQLAVMLEHRRILYDEKGDVPREALEAKRIRELGFEPGDPNLF